MKKIFLVLIILTLFFFISSKSIYAFAKGEQNCVKCHSLNSEQAKKILDELIPNLKILNVQNGPIQGLWEIGVDSNGKKNIIYLDYSLKKVIAGNILELSTKTNLTQESFSKINKVDLSSIPYQNALVLGDKNAKNKIVVFDDPDWPYCGKLHQEMKKVISERKDIAFYIIMYPLPMHKDAYEKSKAIVCEKSLKLLEDAFENKKLPEPKCETKAIDENIEAAKKLGINGTPALIFSDGSLSSGYIEAEAIIKMIDKK